MWVQIWVQYILLSCFTHGISNVSLLIVIGCVYMLLEEWAGAALARVKFGCNQLCLNSTNPAPADLLPLYNFIWRCEVLCGVCKLSDL